jgi:hypothetical protein
VIPELSNDRIDRLRDAFLAAGYDADGVLRALGPQAHAALGRNEPVPALRATRDAGPLGTLIRLFLLGQAEEPQAVARALHPLPTEEALAAGLLVPSGDELRAGLDVRPHGVGDESWWVISDLDSDLSGQPVRQDHVLGVGQATLSLVRATPRRQVGSLLDLGTGCGVQALHASTHAQRITGTDVSDAGAGAGGGHLPAQPARRRAARGRVVRPGAQPAVRHGGVQPAVRGRARRAPTSSTGTRGWPGTTRAPW